MVVVLARFIHGIGSPTRQIEVSSCTFIDCFGFRQNGPGKQLATNHVGTSASWLVCLRFPRALQLSSWERERHVRRFCATPDRADPFECSWLPFKHRRQNVLFPEKLRALPCFWEGTCKACQPLDATRNEVWIPPQNQRALCKGPEGWLVVWCALVIWAPVLAAFLRNKADLSALSQDLGPASPLAQIPEAEA